MKNIIKKAIEGGWDRRNMRFYADENGTWDYCYEIAILDHLFWQALGKACRWEKFEEGYDIEGDYTKIETWKSNALQFHEINLTEGFNKAVEWLEEKIK